MKIRIVGQEVEGPFQGAQTLSQEPARLGDYRYIAAPCSDGPAAACRWLLFVFEEWRSTSESADGAQRFFHESIRLPCPRVPVVLRIEAVDEAGACRVLLEQPIAPPTASAGPADAPVSQVIGGAAGDGRPSRFSSCRKATPGRTRPSFTPTPPASASSCSRPSLPLAPRSLAGPRAVCSFRRFGHQRSPRRQRSADPLHASFNTFGIDRCMLTFDNQRLRRVCAREPHYVLTVLCNTAKYGGGGVFNQYACLATDTPYGPYLLLHELGHSFAGLGTNTSRPT